LIIALLILAILAPSGHAVSATVRLPPILSASASYTSSCASVASVDPLITSSASVDLPFLPRLLPSQPHPYHGSSLPRTCTCHCRQSTAVRSQQNKGDKLTLMLDLDKTALYGNDGNDLGIALQWMDKDFSKVQELYRQLINPSLHQVYDFYVQQGKQVEVVIYTRRPQLVYYKSCGSDKTLATLHLRAVLSVSVACHHDPSCSLLIHVLRHTNAWCLSLYPVAMPAWIVRCGKQSLRRYPLLPSS
jgi:hypothetical protein